MKRISVAEIKRIRDLRRSGHSLPEIRRIVGRGAGTIFRYAHAVEVEPKFVPSLRLKQGGSRARSEHNWAVATAHATKLVDNLTSRDKLFLLAGLYWGEGTKRELNIINGDPSLLSVFLECLYTLGVDKGNLRISLRLFEDIERRKAILFWSRRLDVPSAVIHVSEVSKGKKSGKLAHGMCRIRVRRSGPHFKLIMSVIESIKSEISPRSSMDRTAAS